MIIDIRYKKGKVLCLTMVTDKLTSCMQADKLSVLPLAKLESIYTAESTSTYRFQRERTQDSYAVHKRCLRGLEPKTSSFAIRHFN